MSRAFVRESDADVGDVVPSQGAEAEFIGIEP
jgi:hypothetical protein